MILTVNFSKGIPSELRILFFAILHFPPLPTLPCPVLEVQEKTPKVEEKTVEVEEKTIEVEEKMNEVEEKTFEVEEKTFCGRGARKDFPRWKKRHLR